MNPVILRRYQKDTATGKRRTFIECKCIKCGSFFETRADHARKMTGACLICSRKIASEGNKTHGFNNNNSRLHVTWANMKRRCVSPRGKEKKIYLGITLCAEWHDFVPFMRWSLDNGYADGLTIDRIDPGMGYSPDNCRYVSHSVQSANRRITDKNKSGYIGVRFYKGKWVSAIQWEKKQKHLGRFETKEDAAIARDMYILENNLPHTMSRLSLL